MQCQQSVVIESCCDPVQCPDDATMYHPATDAALCAVHYANGEKYALSGEWPVGKRQIPFPDGWEPLPGATSASPSSPLTAESERTASGLYIERAS